MLKKFDSKNQNEERKLQPDFKRIFLMFNIVVECVYQMCRETECLPVEPKVGVQITARTRNFCRQKSDLGADI